MPDEVGTLVAAPTADPELEEIVKDLEDPAPDDDKTEEVEPSKSEEKAESADSDDEDEVEDEEDKDLQDVLKKYSKVLEGKSPKEQLKFISKVYWDTNNRAAASAKELKALQAEHDKMQASMKELQAKAKIEEAKPEPLPEEVTRIEKHVERLESRLKEKQARRDNVLQDANKLLDEVKFSKREMDRADEVSKDRLTAEHRNYVDRYNQLVANWEALNDVCETLVDDIDSRRDQLEKAKQYISKQREEISNREREQQQLEQEVANAGTEAFTGVVNSAIAEYGLVGAEADRFFKLAKANVMQALEDAHREGKTQASVLDIEEFSKSAVAEVVEFRGLDKAKSFTEASKKKASTDKAMRSSGKATASSNDIPERVGPVVRPQSWYDAQANKVSAYIRQKHGV
jgi:chromosome segregation ATPase